ncbi:MAG: leucyl/phenylalanyl-tRNA--protein transferase [Pseudomonadota bacterium]
MSIHHTSGAPFLLDPAKLAFPDPRRALREPNGLLAIGGDLSPQRLLAAYRLGIFPWYGRNEPILWWSPDPRCVLFPDLLHISRSLQKTLRRNTFELSIDRAFPEVMKACAAPRRYTAETWITSEVYTAYNRLHQLGHAHSVEARHNGELVGGLYGVALGKVFYGESMFARITDASKVAMAHLCQRLQQWGYELIDCQMHTTHLVSLGAVDIPRADFMALLNSLLPQQPAADAWQSNPQSAAAP